MREILFKGKRKENGKWIEGYYQKRYDDFENIQHIIFWSKSSTVWEYAEIDPESVCQYTGLTDKNGRKIFEGDIVKDILSPIVGIVRYGRYRNTFNEDGYGGHVGFYVEWKEKRDLLRKDLVYWINESEFIGNIFDNPELIGDQP